MSGKPSRLSRKKGKIEAVESVETPLLDDPIDSTNNDEAGNIPTDSQAASPLKSTLKNLLAQEATLQPLVTSMIQLILASPDLLNQLVDALHGAILPKLREAVKQEVKNQLSVDEICQTVYESVTMDVNSIKDDMADLRSEVDQLKTEKEDLIQQVDNQEQYSRRNCLLLHGVPETKGEKTTQICLDHINKSLKLKVNITADQIDRSHRIGKPKSGTSGEEETPKPRPIIVKFTSYQHRADVFRNKRYLKGTGLTISESLTPSRMNILRKAQQVARLGNIKNTWTQDGTIIVMDNQDNKVPIRKLSDLSIF